jgi:EmrB/QacA subfamily drug resistance transporter
MESFPSESQQQAPAATWAGPRLTGWALASVLAGLMLTLLLSALDQTIVGTALPKIITDLQGADLYIWPTTAYLLASTTMIPIVGKLSDQFGRKWFLVTGIVVFLIGSALSGASQTMNQLIAFRAIQGLGGGVLMSLVFTLVGDIFTPAERARWQGLFTAVFGLASVIGPAAGGFITDNFSWHWIFYVNLPVGVLALAAIIVWLPANISVRTTVARGWAAFHRIDIPGALTAASATILLLLGLTWGGNRTYDWSSPQVVGTLAGAVALFVAFFVVERFAVEPILPLDLFRNQTFAVGALLSLTVGMALLSVAIYLPLFVQGVLGQTATNSGVIATPLTLALAVGAAIVGQIIARVGRYQIFAIIGAVVLAGGIYLLTQMTLSSTLAEVTRNMIVIGLGLGMIQPVMTLAVQNAIPRSRLGVGTGAVTYLRSTGSTLGVAIVGAVEYNAYTTELTSRLPAAARPFISKLKPDLLQQLLLSPAGQHSVEAQAAKDAVAQVLPNAVNQAVVQALTQLDKQVPPGPLHNQIVAQQTLPLAAKVTQQVTEQVTAQVTARVDDTFHQIFEATRQSLAVGIQHGFIAGLILCGLLFVLTLFLKDIPLQTRAAAAPANGDTPVAFTVAAAEPASNGHAPMANGLAQEPGATPQQPNEPRLVSSLGAGGPDNETQ